jgi:PAS domain S-box-containing protein
MEPGPGPRNLPTFRPLVAQIPALIWTTDTELRFTSSDGAVLQGMGHSAHEAVGMSLPQWLQSDDPDLPPVRVSRRALLGEPGSYTYEWNGRLFHVRIEPLRDPSGTITGTIALAADVTDMKEIDEAARLNEQRFRLVFEHSPIGIGIGQRGLLRFVNAAWVRMFGYSDPAQIVGTDLLQHIAPECRAGMEEKFQKWESGENALGPTDTFAVRKDGTRFVLHVDLTRIPLHGGEGSIIFGRDLTAQRRAEEDLRDSERQLREAQQVGKIGSWEWDLVTLKVTWSGELYQIFGLDAGAYTPSFEGYLSRVHSEDRDRVASLISKAHREAGRLCYECRIIWPDGSVRVIDVRGQVLLGPGKQPLRMVGVAADITERKATEEALVAARAELETRVKERTAELARANKDLLREIKERKLAQAQLIRSEKLASTGMVVSGVAHEINNPLNVICGNLGLLTEPARLKAMTGAGVNPAERRKIRMMLGDANRAAQRARLIIETFRHFARDVRQAEWVDLNECLEEALSIVRRQARDAVRTRTRLRTLPKIKCFRAQIVQVFVNLVRNAYEAVDGKGSVTLETGKVRRSVMAKVIDTGCGIPPEIRARLFEPFVTSKPPGKGLGLGLSISAAIIQNHQGRIEVKSRKGRGTEFRITIPVASEKAPLPPP